METISSLPGKNADNVAMTQSGKIHIPGGEGGVTEIRLPREVGFLVFVQWGVWGGLCGCYMYFSAEPYGAFVRPVTELPNAEVTAEIIKNEQTPYAVAKVKNKTIAEFICYKYVIGKMKTGGTI